MLRIFMGVFLSVAVSAVAQEPVRVAVVGLEHGHAGGVFSNIEKNHDVKLVAIVEADKPLREKYAARFHLDAGLFYDDMDAMFAKTKPEVVLAYNAVQKHREVVVKAAEHGVSAMVEKPLATTLEDAEAMKAAAVKHHTQLLVNYETTWYASNAEVLKEWPTASWGMFAKSWCMTGMRGRLRSTWARSSRSG